MTPARSTWLPGIPFLNRLLDTGLPAGQLIGLVGPSGGGKTLLSVQIAHALAIMNKRSVYVTLERNNHILRRLKKLVNGEPLEDTGEDLDAQRERIFNLRAEKITHLDIESLDPAPLDDLYELPPDPPDLIVIDQLALWIMVNERNAEDHVIQEYCAYAKSFCERTGCTVLLPHQLKGDLKSAPATRFPETTDAAGSHLFGHAYVDTGLFIGCQNEQALCWISVPAMGNHEIAWLDGDCARFRSAGEKDLYFEANPRTKTFSLTAWSMCFDLRDPADVCAYVDGRFSVSKTQETGHIDPFPAGTASGAAPADSRTAAAPISPHSQECPLSAATPIASELTLEHGRRLLALLLTDQHATGRDPVLRFALWCRCNGRRDFLDLLPPASYAIPDHLTAPFSAEENRDFHHWLLTQTAPNVQSGAGAIPALTSIPAKKMRFNKLYDLYSEHHSALLRLLWINHRKILAREAGNHPSNVNFRLIAAPYGDKNDSIGTWEKAYRLFVNRDVSPSRFFSACSMRYQAIPWPASFASFIDEFPADSPPALRYSIDANPYKILETVRHADLSPWEVAALGLSDAAINCGAMSVIPPYCWALLSWMALGNPDLRQQLEPALLQLALHRNP